MHELRTRILNGPYDQELLEHCLQALDCQDAIAIHPVILDMLYRFPEHSERIAKALFSYTAPRYVFRYAKERHPEWRAFRALARLRQHHPEMLVMAIDARNCNHKRLRHSAALYRQAICK